MSTLCLMEDVRKSFPMGEDSVEVLKGVDLSVERGEIAAIMGVSGSGKSTLMNLIGCLDVPTSGRYLFADREVLGLVDDELSELRNAHIGFVFQSFYLLPYATVLENVLLPSIYRESTTDNARERAVELLRLIGLGERLHFRPNRLSGGEQQRVAICRALMNDPELVLADEPTGQLDSRTAAEIMNLLVMMNQRGKTVIIVTHDPAIAAYAKRIIRIKDGVIVDGQAD
jgi:putative ABC transport system ATP-binding protein